MMTFALTPRIACAAILAFSYLAHPAASQKPGFPVTHSILAPAQSTAADLGAALDAAGPTAQASAGDCRVGVGVLLPGHPAMSSRGDYVPVFHGVPREHVDRSQIVPPARGGRSDQCEGTYIWVSGQMRTPVADACSGLQQAPPQQAYIDLGRAKGEGAPAPGYVTPFPTAPGRRAHDLAHARPILSRREP